MTFHWYFILNINPFRQAVSKEKIFLANQREESLMVSISCPIGAKRENIVKDFLLNWVQFDFADTEDKMKMQKFMADGR